MKEIKKYNDGSLILNTTEYATEEQNYKRNKDLIESIFWGFIILSIVLSICTTIILYKVFP